MPLIINTIKSSSIKIEYSYLDTEKIFGYEVTADYTVDVSDVSFDQDSVLLNGYDALKEAYLQKNLVARIGTDEFINGRIISLSLPETSAAGGIECRLSIQESKSIDSDNQWADKIASPQWLSSFTENYNFSRSEDSYSYTRNVSIQYKQDAGNQFLNNARLFLRNFYLQNRPNLGFQTDGISEDGRTDAGFKPLITETYDLVNLSVSLVENFESSYIIDNYSKKNSYSLAIGNDGFLEKKYSIELKALKEPLEKIVNDACKDVIDEIASENFAQFKNPISIEKTIGHETGVISIGVSFTTDPRKQGSSTIYTATKTKRGAYLDYSLNATFAAEGKTRKERFEATKTLWADFQGTQKEKIGNLFSVSESSIYEKARSVELEPEDGKISENSEFSDDPAYNDSSLPDGIIKLNFSRNTKEQNFRSFKFLDLKDLREKLIGSDKKTIGEGSLTVNLIPIRSRGIFFGQNYLESQNYLDSTQYKTSDQISLDSANGTTSRVISYVFTE